MLYYNMCMCMFSTFIYHYVSIVRSIEPTGILGLEINIIIIIIREKVYLYFYYIYVFVLYHF